MPLPSVAVTGTRADGTSASLAPAYPAGILADDLIFLHAFFHEGTTTTTGTWAVPTGFTLLRRQNLTVAGAKTGELAVFWKLAAGGETGTVAVTRTGGTGNTTVSSANMIIVRGADTAAWSNGLTGVTDETPPYTMTVTTTLADSLVLAWIFANDNLATTGTDAAWTNVVAPYVDATGIDYAGHAASRSAAATGAYSGSWSQSAGVEGVAIGLGIAGAAAPTPNTATDSGTGADVASIAKPVRPSDPYGQAVFDLNPDTHYRAVAGVLTDIMRGPNGAIVGGPTLGEPALAAGGSPSILLNGSTQHLNAGKVFDYGNGGWTQAILMKRSSVTAPATSMPLFAGGVNSGGCSIDNGGVRGNGFINAFKSGVSNTVHTATPYLDLATHLVVLTKSPAQVWTIYVDGVDVSDRTGETADSTATTAVLIGFGWDPNTGNHFAGWVAEPATWSRDITNAEQATLWAAVGAATAKTASDSATGSDSTSLVVSFAPTDAAAGTDTASPAFAAATTDSAAGGDVSALSQTKAGTDSGVGTDSGTPGASLPQTDAAAGTDAPAATTSADTGTDSGAGADVASAANPQVAADSATGTETATPGAVLSRTESASGADTATQLASATRTDAGAAADASALAVSQPVQDLATGAEGPVTTSAAVNATDSGAGLDVSFASTDTSKVVNDSAIGSDAAFSNRVYQLLDAALGVDSSALTDLLAALDSGFGADIGTFAITFLDVHVSDAGVGSDTILALAAAVTTGDTGVGTDTGTKAEKAAGPQGLLRMVPGTVHVWSTLAPMRKDWDG